MHVECIQCLSNHQALCNWGIYPYCVSTLCGCLQPLYTSQVQNCQLICQYRAYAKQRLTFHQELVSRKAENPRQIQKLIKICPGKISRQEEGTCWETESKQQTRRHARNGSFAVSFTAVNACYCCWKVCKYKFEKSFCRSMSSHWLFKSWNQKSVLYYILMTRAGSNSIQIQCIILHDYSSPFSVAQVRKVSLKIHNCNFACLGLKETLGGMG